MDPSPSPAAAGPCPTARAAALLRGLLAGLAGVLLTSATPAQTADARRVAAWAARAHDHDGKAFFVVDKVRATLYLFDAGARLQARTPVLLGAARGDDSVPGIGTRPMTHILPGERTTPAGRFVAEGGRNQRGEDVVWIDHDAAVSMHRVRATVAQERRLERLRTATAGDNRISYGCINVPVAFYDRHVRAVFATGRTAVVYVLPETRSLQAQFGLRERPARIAAR